MNVAADFPYTPLPKQKEFHDSKAKFKGFFGGMGSGKTMAGVAEGWKLTFAYPGNYGLVGRLTYPELRDTTWKEFINYPVVQDGKEMPIIQSRLIKRYDKQKMEIECVNGSTVIGRALDDAFDKLAKGLNLGWFWADELTEIDEKLWDGITGTRLRRKPACWKCRKIVPTDTLKCPKCDVLVIRHTAFGTSNPEGHDWVWKKFVMNQNKNYFYVQADSADNFHLPTDYISELEKMPEDWKKRYLHGSFDTFEGLVYKEWQDREPYIAKEFTVPSQWYRFVAMDHGYRNPSCILWFAVDPKGNAYIYDEFYSSGKLVSELADIIKTKNGGQKVQSYLIDPSCRNRNGVTGRSVIDEFSDNGVFFQGANNDVRAGINHVQEMFSLNKDGPKLKIFPTCTNLRTELQTYRWKDLRPGVQRDGPEQPVKKDDHAVDALRYGCVYLYETPEIKMLAPDWRDWYKGETEVTSDHWMAA